MRPKLGLVQLGLNGEQFDDDNLFSLRLHCFDSILLSNLPYKDTIVDLLLISPRRPDKAHAQGFVLR